MTWNDWTPIIVAGVSALVAIYSVWRQTRKDKTDIAKQVSEAWEKLIKPLEDRVASLEAENKKLRDEREARERRIEELEVEIESLRREVARWKPRTRKES